MMRVGCDVVVYFLHGNPFPSGFWTTSILALALMVAPVAASNRTSEGMPVMPYLDAMASYPADKK